MNDPSDLPWVQLAFVDVFGTPCSMLLPSTRWDDAVARGVPFDGSALEGRARLAESDMLLVPDPATAVPIADDRSRVVCNVVTSDGAAWPGDPRTTLLELGSEAREDAGMTFGAELELYLLDGQNRPTDRGGYFDDLDAPGMEVIQASASELRRLGVEVSGCHHEAGHGQYEIDLAPAAAVVMADAIVLAKHVVRATASASGLVATFMARPLLDQPGSGLHIHQRAEALLESGSGTLTPDGRSFIAGQLAHADALSALAAPNVNSYRRLHAGAEAPSAAVWGHRNRGALIRVGVVGDDPSIEYRGADPAANPYLLLGALVVAGQDGIQRGTELCAPNDEMLGTFDPGEAVRFEPLPRSLDGALDALVADDLLVDALDPSLIDILTAGRRAELAEHRSRVTSWELDRYLLEA